MEPESFEQGIDTYNIKALSRGQQQSIALVRVAGALNGYIEYRKQYTYSKLQHTK